MSTSESIDYAWDPRYNVRRPLRVYDSGVVCISCGKTGLLLQDKHGQKMYSNVEADGYHKSCR